MHCLWQEPNAPPRHHSLALRRRLEDVDDHILLSLPIRTRFFHTTVERASASDTCPQCSLALVLIS